MKRKMIITILVVIAAAVVFVSCGGGSNGGNDTSSDPNTVLIEDYAYLPVEITIQAGETVTWINKDSVGHTSTDTEGEFDSGMLGRDESYEYTFDNPGVYDYYCIPHPYMKGKVIVE